MTRILALHVGAWLAVFFILSRQQHKASPVLFGMPAWLYPLAAFVVLIVVGSTIDMRMPRGLRAATEESGKGSSS